MTRRQRRNPRGWQRFRASKRGIAIAGSVVVAATTLAILVARRTKTDGKKIRPTILTLPKPSPLPPGPPSPDTPPLATIPEGYGSRAYGTQASIKVSQTGDTYDLVLRQMKAGESIEVTAEVRATVYMQNNAYFGNPQGQFCEGIVLHARVAMGQYNGHVTDTSSEPYADLCGDDPRTAPFPEVIRPRLAIDTDGHDLVLRIDAAPITYANETPSAQGESTTWWDDHTGPWKYDLGISLAVIEKPL